MNLVLKFVCTIIGHLKCLQLLIFMVLWYYFQILKLAITIFNNGGDEKLGIPGYPYKLVIL